MANNKYINTKEAVRLTGLSTQEIYDLIHNGKLPAHKAPKSGWRISLQDLTTLGLIQEEMAHTSEVVKTEDGQKEDIITCETQLEDSYGRSEKLLCTSRV